MSAPPPSSRDDRVACAFDTALLAGCAACSLAEKTPVGEQILVYCRQPKSAERCRSLLARLRRSAGFALPGTRGSAPMTHGHSMRLRCGGLRGLADQADGIAPGGSVADVASLVDRLADARGTFDGIAWDQVVREITAWRAPVRRNRN